MGRAVAYVTIGVGILVAAVVATIGIGLLLRWRDGRFRPLASAEQTPTPALSSADLDQAPLGERVTLVHFSSAFCAPCRATRQVLTQVSEAVDGVRQVEIDAESHLELVRRLGVRRTPTVLVLDPDGRILTRATGALRTSEVRAVVEAYA